VVIISRHAQYSLGDFKAAADAFERGIRVEPTNAGLKSSLASAKAKLPAEGDATARSAPTANADAGAGLGGLADMMRNMGGGGGGMPDLSSLMSNPAIMSMAQQMTQNGGLDRLMRDPSVANMVSAPSLNSKCFQ
jgi:small glutamine-rich tetratricopeptide repeat-containing protein alpha